MSAPRQPPDDPWVEWDREEEGGPPPTFAQRFTARPNLGTWIGVTAMFTFLAATALPWYAVNAEVAPYIDRTTIIQFDGIRGLTIDPRLHDALGFSMPSVLLPLTVVAAIMLLFRLRSLFKAPTPGKRAWSFIRATIGILLPIAVAVFIISQVPNYLPPDSPQQLHELAGQVGAHPFGGAYQMHVNVTTPGGPFTGDAEVYLDWGFGPALYVMMGAVGLYIIGAVIEMGAARRLREERY